MKRPRGGHCRRRAPEMCPSISTVCFLLFLLAVTVSGQLHQLENPAAHSLSSVSTSTARTFPYPSTVFDGNDAGNRDRKLQEIAFCQAVCNANKREVCLPTCTRTKRKGKQRVICKLTVRTKCKVPWSIRRFIFSMGRIRGVVRYTIQQTLLLQVLCKEVWKLTLCLSFVLTPRTHNFSASFRRRTVSTGVRWPE